MNSNLRTGTFLTVAGVALVLSGVVVNSYVAGFWRNNIVNYRDASDEYTAFALILGGMIAISGWLVSHRPSLLLRRIGMLLFAMALVAIPDRLLLARYGKRLFVRDKENIFSYRKSTTRTWGPEFGGKLIRINRHGLRDDEFPVTKSDSEFRILFVGDSVTMGHGVSHEETFCTLIENLGLAGDSRHKSWQVINAGVQGYSTWQEFNMINRCRGFDPDVVMIGFCLNDITEPFVTDKTLGGIGVDQRGIMQSTSPFPGWLLSETGYGRLVQNQLNSSQKVALAKREEVFNVARMIKNGMDAPEFKPAWNKTLFDLERIYALCRDQKLRVVLVVFPYSYQVISKELRWPQELLAGHARKCGVECVDVLGAFDAAIEGKQVRQESLPVFFLDENHFSAQGHELVATALCGFLKQPSDNTEPGHGLPIHDDAGKAL
ncbi:MAG: hypothetical protein C0404_01765 [Verrucomicrobia bacterium]|nr:hypothetical protein [Verrucomicrobiota bacterium]